MNVLCAAFKKAKAKILQLRENVKIFFFFSALPLSLCSARSTDGAIDNAGRAGDEMLRDRIRVKFRTLLLML